MRGGRRRRAVPPALHAFSVEKARESGPAPAVPITKIGPASSAGLPARGSSPIRLPALASVASTVADLCAEIVDRRNTPHGGASAVELACRGACARATNLTTLPFSPAWPEELRVRAPMTRQYSGEGWATPASVFRLSCLCRHPSERAIAECAEGSGGTPRMTRRTDE